MSTKGRLASPVTALAALAGAGLLLGTPLAPRGASLPEARADDEALAERAAALASQVKGDLGAAYSVKVVRGLFVLGSNAGADLTAQGEGTIGFMVDALYAEFLSRRPTRPLSVYCFGDKRSYDAYVQRAYGHAPTTPYGFYVAQDRRMVMNLATGTGTLAHELVHPLLAEDFPEVPSWFNEGFASLFEQSRFVEGRGARGLPNWRLPALQRAISEGTAPSLEAVMRTSTRAFYDDRASGMNYAVARYLCYFLQEHGALADFYAEFKASAGRDPTGIAALERTMGVPIGEVQGVWERFTRKVKFER